MPVIMHYCCKCQITVHDLTSKQLCPLALCRLAIEALMQKIVHNGIAIVAENGEPATISLCCQKCVSCCEKRDMSAPSGVCINDPVRMYLCEIGRVSLQPAAVLLALALCIELRALLPCQRLAVPNYSLVVSIACRTVGRGMQFLD